MHTLNVLKDSSRLVVLCLLTYGFVIVLLHVKVRKLSHHVIKLYPLNHFYSLTVCKI